MSNDFYEHGSYPATGAAGASAAMRSELDLVAAGFDKMPALTGNGDKAVVVNAGGTALTVTTGTLALAGNFATSGASALTLTTTGPTNVTLPTTGTLATLAGTESLTNKTLTSPTVTTSIVTGSASFTAFAGATTLLTIGGTGASASMFMPSTLDATSSVTGAIRTSGGISAAKAANFGTTLTVGGITTLGGALVGAASQAVFNTVSTTVNAFGAATTVNIGAATGTLTVNNTTLAAKAGAFSTSLSVALTSQLTGNVGVGGAANSQIGLYVQNDVPSSTNLFGVRSAPLGAASTTNTLGAFESLPRTTAAAYTTTTVYGYRAYDATKGAGSTITTQHGILIDDLTAGVTNRGITIGVTAGTNKYGIITSTAMNVFVGNTRIGGGTDPTVALDVTGAAIISSTLKVGSLGAFASSDKYVIVDSSGNFHKSALGPAS